MKFLDILITSPQYFYKKSVGTRQENLSFDIYTGLRVKQDQKFNWTEHLSLSVLKTPSDTNVGTKARLHILLQ